jgi:HAD superfamily hydrolase (TIGR01490 family)
VTPAAFFDLDRTLIRRSSALALAGAFREHGVIGRGQLAKAAAWQLLFAARGAGAETVRKAAEDGLMILRGFAVDDLRSLVAGAMEAVLKPLVYREALELVDRHRERGERVYIVSATLQEIVEELARELGFDGAVGSVCEVVDGVYTGRSLRAAHGGGKAAAVRELAGREGLDLAASTAYSDSHTDLPFLEAVGKPVAVKSAAGRFSSSPTRPFPRTAGMAYARRSSGSRSCSAREPPSGPRAAVPRPEERLAALGFSEADAATLAAHFVDAERRGKLGHGLSRLDWLETLPGLDPAARPRRVQAEPGYERWDGGGAVGYLTLSAVVDAQLADPPPQARVVVASRCFPTGVLGWYVRRLAEGGLVAALTATSPPRLAHPDGGEPLTGTNPLALAIPSSDGRPLVADVSMGAVTHGDVLRGAARPEELVPFGGAQAHKAFALAVGLELLVGALAGPEPGAVLVVARPDADPVPALRERARGLRLPGDA